MNPNLLELKNGDSSQKTLRDLIADFDPDLVQSEAEVRTKLVIPLLQWLGYDASLRAEEFPVYGNEGRKKISAKSADFLLFSSKEFAIHRERRAADIHWVQDHSLLVVEVKKPCEEIDDTGQAHYYSMWTKAPAFLQTNGRQIKGFLLESLIGNRAILDSEIRDLVNNGNLLPFSFQNLRASKEKALEKRNREIQIITRDEDLALPQDTISYIKHCMGKNGIGLSNVQLVSRYLRTIDSILENKLSYDVPAFMINIPRIFTKGYVYVQQEIAPIFEGEIWAAQCNGVERVSFSSESLRIEWFLFEGNLNSFSITFRARSSSVTARIKTMELIGKCLFANTIRVHRTDDHREYILPLKDDQKKWIERKRVVTLFDQWLQELKMLAEIELHYNTKFDLKPVGLGKDVEMQSLAINAVYDGIKKRQNAQIVVPKEEANEFLQLFGHISEEILYTSFKEECASTPIEDKFIQGVQFKADKLFLLPGHCIPQKGTGEVYVNACCEYRMISAG